MSFEERVKAELCAGAFSDCLVDGNSEQTARQRKIKHRALAISISLQTLGLTALVIAPLLAKPAELTMQTVPPMPIYGHRPAHPHSSSNPAPRPPTQPCFKCAISRPIPVTTERPVDGAPTPPDGSYIPGTPETPEGIPLADPRNQPPRPDPVVEVKRVLRVGHIDPALLVHRVEPAFPPIAKQLHRNGKVELHALIATDGSVQSLQVVSGDPLFIDSARNAVLQWRYQPTKLNGQAVEVDTYITVIYTLQ